MAYLLKTLKHNLEYYEFCLPELRHILKTFNLNKITYAVVGGFIKNKAENSFIHDIDIIVDASQNELFKIVERHCAKYVPNSFGGYKMLLKGFINLEVDIWSLESHKTFQIFNVPKTWKNLPKTSWLSTQSAVWFPQKNKIWCKDLKKTIKSNKIYFRNYDVFKKAFANNFGFNNFALGDRYTISIAAHLAKNYRYYDFDDNCWNFLKIYFSEQHGDRLEKYLEEHSTTLSYNHWEKEIGRIKKVLENVTERSRT